MINKANLLKALTYYNEADNPAVRIDNGALKVTQDNYEYVFVPTETNYLGDGVEFVVASLSDDSWIATGQPVVVGNSVTLDGASWLSRGAIELGGQDWQISGRAFEIAEDMAVRRKIFELYTSPDLNISLYSSGAGKNLDLLVKCGGKTYDNYNEPALLAVEYNFALKWQQSAGRLMLAVNGAEIYLVEIPGLSERRIFEQVIIGGSVYHAGAAWKGTIANLRIYDGYCEG